MRATTTAAKTKSIKALTKELTKLRKAGGNYADPKVKAVHEAIEALTDKTAGGFEA